MAEHGAGHRRKFDDQEGIPAFLLHSEIGILNSEFWILNSEFTPASP
ncbi:MAG: hypothetical protein KA419_08260 [Acidobacteria bacterium]|nr:hypothetical protein [Acidobacteriota bacterium]